VSKAFGGIRLNSVIMLDGIEIIDIALFIKIIISPNRRDFKRNTADFHALKHDTRIPPNSLNALLASLADV
jgi:hypothetical protein